MIRLGVIGNGRIAARFVKSAKLVPEVQIVCIYNPRKSSAEAFVAKNGIGMATDEWEILLSRVDAVYIASPHATHVDYARRALLGGKHVFCEKPMAFFGKEASELFSMASERGLVLMEAVKTAYAPGYMHLIETAKSGKIGAVRDVEACFTKLTDPAGRELTDTVYGGALIELGTYVLLPVIELFGEDPGDVMFYSVKDAKGLDLFTKVHLGYEEGFGLGKVGLGVKSEGELIISGTKGYLYAKAPWWLTREFEIRYEDPNERERHTFEFEGDGLHYELQAFVKEIQTDRRDDSRRKRLSIAFAAVMERFLCSRSPADQKWFRQTKRDGLGSAGNMLGSHQL